MEDILIKEFDSKIVNLEKNNKNLFSFAKILAIFILLSLIVVVLSLFKTGFTSINLRSLKLKNSTKMKQKLLVK